MLRPHSISPLVNESAASWLANRDRFQPSDSHDASWAVSPREMAEFWIDQPIASRDLFRGPIDEPGPKVDAIYTMLEKDEAGFSPAFELMDAAGTLWNVKIGPEAKTEVVASRLVWAMGYHQLPTYYVPRWKSAGERGAESQSAGRFRARSAPYRKIGDWSWHENPFVGTRPYKGLLALMAMLNNSDLKPEQNAMFEVSGGHGARRRLFVIMGLGRSAERVDFEPHALRAELSDQIAVADVQWICRRLARLTDKQWRDAFRAANYHPTESIRFIIRMKAKIAQGLRAMPDSAATTSASHVHPEH